MIKLKLCRSILATYEANSSILMCLKFGECFGQAMLMLRDNGSFARWNRLTVFVWIMCINLMCKTWTSNQWLPIYSWTGSVLASAYSQRGTARPILSLRDFRQASSVLQPKAFYF